MRPELLKQELASPSWKPEPIVMSAITDIYQPIEHKMRIARQCLEVLADCGQPVTTMTKSALVLRDTDLWSRLAEMNAGRVTITLVTLDADLAQKLEPRASSPAGRLRAIRELTAAGIPVSVNVAPIIPGLTDTELPRILEAVAEAGAAGRRGCCCGCRISSRICFSTGSSDRSIPIGRGKSNRSSARRAAESCTRRRHASPPARAAGRSSSSSRRRLTSSRESTA